MTKSDKVEIANLIENATKMAEFTKKLSAPYRDKSVADYAKAAIKDALEAKRFILSVIDANLQLFFNPSKIELGTHPCSGNPWWNLRDNKPLSFGFGDLNIVVKIRPETVKKFVVGTYEASFATTLDGITISDVCAYTSNTSRPEYNICTNDDLVFSNRFTNLDLDNGKYSTEYWRCVYNAANATKAKTKFMVDSLKRFLVGKSASLKAIADKKEEAAAAIADVGVYKKVSF